MKYSVQKQADMLLKMAKNNSIDPYKALDALLDYLIGTFDVNNLGKFDYDLTAVFVDAKERNEDMFMLLTDWFTQVTQEMEKGQGYLDWFGAVYEEMFKGKAKASVLGQFFTPESLCTMMAKMTATEKGRFNDCACGSGRTMLAAYAESDKTKFSFYDAADIDQISCKMCALNFMIHGMIGEVRCQDTLRLDTPAIVYHVNEIRYPFPTNMYSLRMSYPRQTATKQNFRIG